MGVAMVKTILTIAAVGLALAGPAAAASPTLEGKWANPKRSIIVDVARCGPAYCGTVAWANDRNRDKVAEKGRQLVGARILSDLRPAGGGMFRGRAYEPKRNVRGSATVRQVGPDVMMVKGCAVAGILCKEQRWTRVS